MRKLRAGLLKHRISIQRYYEDQDENGNIVGIWVEIKRTRAFINPTSGDEIVINNQIVNNIDNEIFLRFTDVTAKDRIVYKKRAFDIKRVLNFEYKNIFLHVLAKENLSYKDVDVFPAVTYKGIPVVYKDTIVTH